jgi:hypothetical protein
VNSASLDHLFVILAGGALEIVGIAKKIMMGRVGRSMGASLAVTFADHTPASHRDCGNNERFSFSTGIASDAAIAFSSAM